MIKVLLFLFLIGTIYFIPVYVGIWVDNLYLKIACTVVTIIISIIYAEDRANERGGNDNVLK